MKEKDITTLEYLEQLSNTVLKIESHARVNKIRRLILLLLTVLTCFIGALLGLSKKSHFIEAQYEEYKSNLDNSILTDQLLSYKDTFSLFESKYLGNSVSQSLIGGFFYDDGLISIYPDEHETRTVILIENKEVVLCEGIASDLNVSDSVVFYRMLNSRQVYAYNISTNDTTLLPLENVGQFVVFDNKIYYLDLSDSSVKRWDFDTNTISEIVEPSVVSFAIIGNDIFFLSKNHVLYKQDVNTDIKTCVASNVVSFSFDGMLWIQNNDKLYKETLDKNEIIEFTLDYPCNRFLGITGTRVYFESTDGIYVLDTQTSIFQKAEGYVFVGASGGNVLAYNTSKKIYQMLKSNY